MRKLNSFIFNSKFLRIVLFSIVLFLTFIMAGKFFEEYDDIKKRWDYFYSLPINSLDILILGNSHAYSTYNPDVIDAICKTNSFIIASNSQKIEQTYFNLKEALKYQDPKIVVIQLSVLSGDSWKTHKGDYRVYSNLDGMRFSLNKIKALKEQRPKKDYINGLIPLLRNHQNWKNKELILKNIGRLSKKKLDDYRGFSPRRTEMTDNIAKKYINEKKINLSNYKISETDKNYLKKIKNLSIKNGFDIIYVMSPKYSDMTNKSYISKYNYLNNITSNFQSDYLDFNILGNEVGLNQRSFENGYIGYQHTSYYGAVQISAFLADHISKSYNVLRTEKWEDEDWKSRMNQKLEYYVFDRTGRNIDESIDLGSEMKLFEDVTIKKAYLIKSEGSFHELIIEFNDSLNIKKIQDHKFYVHLYPEDKDGNIKEERKEIGYENYDFKPYLLANGKNQFFLSRKIESKIKNVKTLNLGLFKSGSTQRSNELSFKQINLN